MRAAEARAITTSAPFDVAALFDGLSGAPGVAIAVSGGSDSMALLHLAQLWGKAPLTALTVDHGLRPESASEALQVKAWCEALGLPHHTLTWRGPHPATGVQAAARQARYDLMTDACLSRGIPVLLTGHTLDDQAETVAMRSKRSRSVASLAGIWPKTRWNGIAAQRPLLTLRREALRSWLKTIGQPWIEDPSNHDGRFERVRVRQSMASDGVATLASQADAAREKAQALSAAVEDWIGQNATRHREGYVTFAREEVLALDLPLRLAVIARLIRLAGGSAGLDMAELARASEALAQERKVTLGGAVFAHRRGRVWLAREAGRIPRRWSLVGEEGVLLWDGRFRIEAPPGSAAGPMTLAKAGTRAKALPFFVFEGLPVVRLTCGTCVPALEGKEFAVSAVPL